MNQQRQSHGRKPHTTAQRRQRRKLRTRNTPHTTRSHTTRCLSTLHTQSGPLSAENGDYHSTTTTQSSTGQHHQPQHSQHHHYTHSSMQTATTPSSRLKLAPTAIESCSETVSRFIPNSTATSTTTHSPRSLAPSQHSTHRRIANLRPPYDQLSKRPFSTSASTSASTSSSTPSSTTSSITSPASQQDDIPQDDLIPFSSPLSPNSTPTSLLGWRYVFPPQYCPEWCSAFLHQLMRTGGAENDNLQRFIGTIPTNTLVYFESIPDPKLRWEMLNAYCAVFPPTHPTTNSQQRMEKQQWEDNFGQFPPNFFVPADFPQYAHIFNAYAQSTSKSISRNEVMTYLTSTPHSSSSPAASSNRHHDTSSLPALAAIERLFTVSNQPHSGPVEYTPIPTLSARVLLHQYKGLPAPDQQLLENFFYHRIKFRSAHNIIDLLRYVTERRPEDTVMLSDFMDAIWPGKQLGQGLNQIVTGKQLAELINHLCQNNRIGVVPLVRHWVKNSFTPMATAAGRSNSTNPAITPAIRPGRDLDEKVPVFLQSKSRPQREVASTYVTASGTKSLQQQQEEMREMLKRNALGANKPAQSAPQPVPNLSHRDRYEGRVLVARQRYSEQFNTKFQAPFRISFGHQYPIASIITIKNITHLDPQYLGINLTQSTLNSDRSNAGFLFEHYLHSYVGLSTLLARVNQFRVPHLGYHFQGRIVPIIDGVSLADNESYRRFASLVFSSVHATSILFPRHLFSPAFYLHSSPHSLTQEQISESARNADPEAPKLPFSTDLERVLATTSLGSMIGPHTWHQQYDMMVSSKGQMEWELIPGGHIASLSQIRLADSFPDIPQANIVHQLPTMQQLRAQSAQMQRKLLLSKRSAASPKQFSFPPTPASPEADTSSPPSSSSSLFSLSSRFTSFLPDLGSKKKSKMDDFFKVTFTSLHDIEEDLAPQSNNFDDDFEQGEMLAEGDGMCIARDEEGDDDNNNDELSAVSKKLITSRPHQHDPSSQIESMLQSREHKEQQARNSMGHATPNSQPKLASNPDNADLFDTAYDNGDDSSDTDHAPGESGELGELDPFFVSRKPKKIKKQRGVFTDRLLEQVKFSDQKRRLFCRTVIRLPVEKNSRPFPMHLGVNSSFSMMTFANGKTRKDELESTFRLLGYRQFVGFNWSASHYSTRNFFSNQDEDFDRLMSASNLAHLRATRDPKNSLLATLHFIYTMTIPTLITQFSPIRDQLPPEFAIAVEMDVAGSDSAKLVFVRDDVEANNNNSNSNNNTVTDESGNPSPRSATINYTDPNQPDFVSPYRGFIVLEELKNTQRNHPFISNLASHAIWGNVAIASQYLSYLQDTGALDEAGQKRQHILQQPSQIFGKFLKKWSVDTSAPPRFYCWREGNPFDMEYFSQSTEEAMRIAELNNHPDAFAALHAEIPVKPFSSNEGPKNSVPQPRPGSKVVDWTQLEAANPFDPQPYFSKAAQLDVLQGDVIDIGPLSNAEVPVEVPSGAVLSFQPARSAPATLTPINNSQRAPTFHPPTAKLTSVSTSSEQVFNPGIAPLIPAAHHTGSTLLDGSGAYDDGSILNGIQLSEDEDIATHLSNNHSNPLRPHDDDDDGSLFQNDKLPKKTNSPATLSLLDDVHDSESEDLAAVLRNGSTQAPLLNSSDLPTHRHAEEHQPEQDESQQPTVPEPETSQQLEQQQEQQPSKPKSRLILPIGKVPREYGEHLTFYPGFGMDVFDSVDCADLPFGPVECNLTDPITHEGMRKIIPQEQFYFDPETQQDYINQFYTPKNDPNSYKTIVDQEFAAISPSVSPFLTIKDIKKTNDSILHPGAVFLPQQWEHLYMISAANPRPFPILPPRDKPIKLPAKTTYSIQGLPRDAQNYYNQLISAAAEARVYEKQSASQTGSKRFKNDYGGSMSDDVGLDQFDLFAGVGGGTEHSEESVLSPAKSRNSVQLPPTLGSTAQPKGDGTFATATMHPSREDIMQFDKLRPEYKPSQQQQQQQQTSLPPSFSSITSPNPLFQPRVVVPGGAGPQLPPRPPGMPAPPGQAPGPQYTSASSSRRHNAPPTFRPSSPTTDQIKTPDATTFKNPEYKDPTRSWAWSR